MLPLAAETVGRLLIVDRRDRIKVDRDLQFAVFNPADRVDRHFEITVLTLLVDQDVVRMDLSHIPEFRAVETQHLGSHRDVARTVWIVGHSQLLCAGRTLC